MMEYDVPRQWGDARFVWEWQTEQTGYCGLFLQYEAPARSWTAPATVRWIT